MVPTLRPDRHAAVRRVLWAVLLANLAVVAAKVWVGVRSGSLAVLGDAAHSGVDALNNVVGLAAVGAAAVPPDEDHPYGHAKFELLGALAVVVFLSITCFELISAAVGRLLGDQPPPRLDSLTVVLLGATMAVNILVAWTESRAAGRLRSVILAADARHTGADVLITASVLAGLFLASRGWPAADAWLGIVVALLIARSGWEILRTAVPALVDRAAVEAARIDRFVSEVPGVRSVTEVRSRGAIEGEAFVELTIEVDGDQTVVEGHRVADAVERKLVENAGFSAAVVHVEPWSGPSASPGSDRV
ncbi:MAG: cation diffusion facilitator family transporter [Candidatus Palauibacterales bacterium]|nr:cation diffusion facilitator family transporter [Candidatus Palauibacterales bacterium]